jgi:meiotic recombination protein REC8
MDLDLPIFGVDLPEGEAFPAASHQQSSELSEVIQSTSTASAPMRRKRRAARVLPVDLATELRNRDLADWNADYLKNMDAALHARKQACVAQQAKKNAEQFLWGGGIAGVAHLFVGSTLPNPFSMFIGDNLFERVVGVTRKMVAGVKHDHDSGIDDATQGESRRVRQRTGEPEDELGRAMDDEGFFRPGGDEVELPREAVTALDDEQMFSAMPWNMSASIRGSSALPRSGRVGLPDQSRPRSRLVSASPLLNRGQPLRIEPLENMESDGDLGLGGDEFALRGLSSPPTVLGAPDHQYTHVCEALSAEGSNFLDFVTDAIVEKRSRVRTGLEPMSNMLQAEATADIDEITFEELLPFAENKKMIACQGLMMVLALGTKSMLDVQQPDHFGDINLKLMETAKASHVVEISDGEESEAKEVVAEGGL